MVLLHPKSRLEAVGSGDGLSGEGQLQGWFSFLSGDKDPGSLPGSFGFPQQKPGCIWTHKTSQPLLVGLSAGLGWTQQIQ